MNGRTTVNAELDRIWKEEAKTCFQASGTEINYNKPQSEQLVSGPRFEPGT